MIRNLRKEILIRLSSVNSFFSEKLIKSFSVASQVKNNISQLKNRSLLIMRGSDVFGTLQKFSKNDLTSLVKLKTQKNIDAKKVAQYLLFLSNKQKIITDAFVYNPSILQNDKQSDKQQQLWLDVNSSAKKQLTSLFKTSNYKNQFELIEPEPENHVIYAGYSTENQNHDTFFLHYNKFEPGFLIQTKKLTFLNEEVAKFVVIDPRSRNYGLRLILNKKINFFIENFQLVSEGAYEDFQLSIKKETMKQIPILPMKNDKLILTPLIESDFQNLYKAASDPLIWEQHPNPDRYKREVFQNYFKGAILSKGAFLISNAVNGQAIGCSRYYDFDFSDRLVKIGYTFFSRDCWGTSINRQVKALMINYAWNFVDRVHFEVGNKNIRSQIAIQRIGAKKIGQKDVAYFGQPSKTNFIYEIKKSEAKEF